MLLDELDRYSEEIAPVESMAYLLTGVQYIMLDLAAANTFDYYDLDENGVIDIYDIDQIVVDDELSEGEADELYDLFKKADSDGDMELDTEEFENSFYEYINQDFEEHQTILDEVVDWINYWDVDCTLDGDDNCDEERADLHDMYAGEEEESEAEECEAVE